MRRLMQAILVVFLAVVSGILPASSESLWSTEFPGYLSRGSTLATGDTVMVDLGTGFSLSFESATRENKRLNLEFAGGEFGELFSFLPSTSSNGERNVTGDSSWDLSGTMAARVTAIDEAGRVTVRGTRTVSFDGKDDSVSVGGSFDIRDLTMDRAVSFASLVDSTLVFSTVAESGETVIAEADIQAIVEEAVTTTDGGEGEAVAGGSPQITRYQLPLQRRQELLVRYVNRIVDILFSRP